MTAESGNAGSSPGVPSGVAVGEGTVVQGETSFRRYRATQSSALTIGAHCTLNGVQFALGPKGRLRIGDFCCFTDAILLAEFDIQIGNYVFIGWNATLADSDFHPIDAAERVADAIACAPNSKLPRPPVAKLPIVVGNDVYIGPCSVILKGVTIGDGAFIEPGSIVTRAVPAGARMRGNPAKMVEQS